MVIDEKIQNELCKEAQILARGLDRLIEQCDSWLPEEEGRRNVYLRFAAREKARRKAKKRMMMNEIFKFVGIKKRYEIENLCW